MSPGREHDRVPVMIGFTGARSDGTMPTDVVEPIRSGVAKVGAVLREARLGFAHVVEMTNDRIGLRHHLDLFRQVREEHVRAPYSAWMAIAVAGFVREGAVVDLRVIARRS